MPQTRRDAHVPNRPSIVAAAMNTSGLNESATSSSSSQDVDTLCDDDGGGGTDEGSTSPSTRRSEPSIPAMSSSEQVTDEDSTSNSSGGGTNDEGSTRPSTSHSGCAELSPPVPNVPLVTQVKREDDRAKAKVESEGRSPGSTFEARLAMKVATGARKETGKEMKAEVVVGEEEEEEEDARRRFANRLALKMSGEGPGTRSPASASSEGSNDCEDPEMPESSATFEEDGPRVVRISDVVTEIVASLQRSSADNDDSSVRRGSSGSSQITGQRRSTILQWLRNAISNTGSPLDNTDSTRRTNGAYDASHPIQATLVHEASVRPAEPVEVYEAKEVSFFERRGGILFAMMCILLVAAALATVAVVILKDSNETPEPTLQPTLSPTIDPRSTLQVIQTRPTSSRRLRCGFHVTKLWEFRSAVCSAIAAVVLGDPSAYEINPNFNPTTATRWTELDSRRFDLLVYSAQTVERETREVRTLTKGDCLSSSLTEFLPVIYPEGFRLFCAILLRG